MPAFFLVVVFYLSSKYCVCVCVCVCMGCFSCKNLLKILQRAADRRRRRRRRRANEQIHAGYFLYEVFDDTEFTRLYSR